MSATSPRSQIVKRLQDMIPSLDKVQGSVSLEGMLQGSIKPDTAYVYRVASYATDEQIHGESIVIKDTFAIILITKNAKDDGGDDSSDVNDDLCVAVASALLGWVPHGSLFPLEYERGEISFQRNLLIWTEFYSLNRINTNISLNYEPVSEMKTNKKAGIDIYGYRVVASNDDDTVYHPSILNPLDHYRILGIALKDTMIGNYLTVQMAGVLVYPQWNWLAGQRVYLANNGELTQTPTIVSIGTANTPKSIVIHIEQLETTSSIQQSKIATANETIYKGNPIVLDTQGYASIANGQPIGIALSNGNQGDDIQYDSDGIVTLSDWSGVNASNSQYLVVGHVYYSDPVNLGKITDIPPNTGFIQSLGTAIAPTVLDIEIGQIIYL